MQPPKITNAIVLRRTNYGEADRVVTLLTKDYGKITVIAKGVRKIKSRLAGGIEPFSISEVSINNSRGKLDILTGARLIRYYGLFVSDLNKVNTAYDALKQINKLIEENTNDEAGYYVLVTQLFDALESDTSATIIRLWWLIKLSELTGHKIQQLKTVKGEDFTEDRSYAFDIENGGFIFAETGNLKAHHIKFLKISQSHKPVLLCRIKNANECAEELYPYIKAFTELHI